MLVGAGEKGTCYFSVHAQLIQIIPHAAAIITQMLPGTACHMVGAFVFGLFFFNEVVKAWAFDSVVLSTCIESSWEWLFSNLLSNKKAIGDNAAILFAEWK